MLPTQALTLPDLHPKAAAATSFAFQLPSAVRAPRVGGHRGVGQALRGAWRPAFLQPPPVTSSAASTEIVATSAAPASRASLRWWQSLFQRWSFLYRAAATTPVNPPQEPPTKEFSATLDFAAAEVFHFPTAPDPDPAASFWEENRLSAGESVQVYAPAERDPIPAERPRLGRSFLGAYRKGRRAAEAGLQAGDCPYQSKQQKEGCPVNALTRTFQRCWTEGLHDALAGAPERYV